MIAVDVGNTSLNFFSFKRGKIAGKIPMKTKVKLNQQVLGLEINR